MIDTLLLPFQFPFMQNAFLIAMLVSVPMATGYLATNSRVKQDTVMGVVFSGMFGVGIVLYVSVDTAMHLDHILFGNMLGVESNCISCRAQVFNDAVAVCGDLHGGDADGHLPELFPR